MKRLLQRARSQLKAVGFIRRAVFRVRTLGFDRQSIALERARKLMEADNFNAAAAQLEGVEAKKERTWKVLLTCYFTAHRFEEVVSGYETMPDAFKRDFLCRYLYLVAAANLKRPQVAVEVIEDVLKEADSVNASAFLSKVRPFTEMLDVETRKVAVERIVAHASSLAIDQFDILLKCAHDLREKGCEAEALALQNAISREAGSARNSMKLDILDAQIHFWNGRYDLQLAAVNGVLAKQGIDPVGLKDESIPFICENLKAIPVARPPVRGPLVSILMPAYNSADTIAYALESLSNQTYQDFEVIVVDDASSDETAQIVARAVAADPRIRLISQPRNSGAFVARNTALAVAAGEFVTNQDADDWAHPQKIAAAVEELQHNRSIVATWVEHVRCSRQRGFRALNGYFRPDASSLMFRRRPVMEKIGWYDSVRAAGDGEFHLRMERAFGPRSIRRIDKLLSFVSWSEASLSGGGVFQIDSDLGLFSPARSAYRRYFGLWHETADNLYMPFPLEKRLFPVPDSLLPAATSSS